MALSPLAKSEPYNFELESANYPDPGTYRQHVQIKLFAELLVVKCPMVLTSLTDSCVICLLPASIVRTCLVLLGESSQPARILYGMEVFSALSLSVASSAVLEQEYFGL
jgi:hypothetical protein